MPFFTLAATMTVANLLAPPPGMVVSDPIEYAHWRLRDHAVIVRGTRPAAQRLAWVTVADMRTVVEWTEPRTTTEDTRAAAGWTEPRVTTEYRMPIVHGQPGPIRVYVCDASGVVASHVAHDNLARATQD